MGLAFDHLPRAAIIGFPLGHSLSPAIHGFWARREGISVGYQKIETAPGYERFEKAADRLAAKGFRGANVTIPHKENALRYALEKGAASERAQRAGAANMVTFGLEGPYADNADIEGFAASLRGSLAGADFARAVLLGAGGAARAVALALKALGYRDILVANRRRARAEALAGDLGVEGGLFVVDWGAREAALAGADILVNATSLGMTGEPPLELRLDALPESAIVSDIVYKPLETPLLAAAKARGLNAVDGLSMLMHQAVPAYKAWLGREAVVDAELRAALEAALAEAGRK